MSSHARRSLRTTAAAAGIAAIGVGIAAPALAAPDTTAGNDAVSTEAPAPAGPAAGLLGKLPAVPKSISDLPMLFTFQGPTFNTAGPALPVLDGPAATEDAGAAEGAPSPSMLPGPVDKTLGGAHLIGQLNAPAPDPEQITKQNNISGLPSPDAVKYVTGLTGKAMSAAPLR